MNLFQRYGIKEVADVTFYTITSVGEEEIYTPVLFLDTLKVSTLEKVAEKVEAKGGKGNKKLITWNFGKELTLALEDALFSAASMSMIWGGKLESRLSDYTSTIVKTNLANKYGKLNYSTKAYPSPALTDSEWEIVFTIAEEIALDSGSENENPAIYLMTDLPEDTPFVKENRVTLIKKYFQRLWTGSVDTKALPAGVISEILNKIDTLDKIGYIDTDIQDVEVIDRLESCIVKDKGGLKISTTKQKENLFKYYANDNSSSFTIFYDSKTMLPLFRIKEDGKIEGWNGDIDTDDEGVLEESDTFTIKMGTVYKKFTRTVKYKNNTDDGILGKTFVIDAETFPDSYKIVGETYKRDEKTGKDQRFQFVIHRANVSTDTSITLQAEGDPTTFTMSIDVLTPQNGVMMELKQFDVEEDRFEGGTRIVPQREKYSYTATNIEYIQSLDANIENNEIY